MKTKRALAWLVLLALMAAQRAQVSAQSRFSLTIDNIMRGPQLYGYAPQDVRWSGDHQRIYFRWKQASDPLDQPLDTYVLLRESGYPRKLSKEEERNAPPLAGVSTRDRSKTVFARDGDIFLYDFLADKATQLTKTADEERGPHFTRDEQRVVFQRDNNLYVIPLSGGAMEQITDIRPAGAPDNERKPPDPKTIQGFLQNQEKELIGAVRDRVRRIEAEEAERKRENPRQPLWLGARQRVASMELCPDEQCVIVHIEERPEGAKSEDVPNYVTESAYTAMIPGRSNVGDQQERTKMGIIKVATGEVTWVDLGLGDREVQFYGHQFNEQGTHAVLMVRSMDNKDRWLFALDPATGKATTIFTEHDEAWIDGPGDETMGWLKDGRTVYFQSERDGYAHLYTVPISGGAPRQLTSGKWEVTGVRLSNDGSRFYLTTSETTPAERHFYSMSVNGGERTRITTMPGSHAVTLSRDERYIADVYSYVNRPPELYTGENRPAAAEEKRTDSPAKEFWDYPWLDAPIVHVPARDGAMIPARLFKPANYQRGGPAVIFVHGAGYLQNVHKYWSPNYPREFLFHHFLMEHGYIVLDLDYRASAGYGRDWRTAIYRHMGGKDLEDNLDGAKYLVEQHGVDPRRIGIYGGSYGGFITLMAMFTSPDTFRAGAALRPVTDWSHYNHGYTSNILNTPLNDPEAFRRSSPIFFAEGLKGALLICHGMVDTNVFFQDTVRLVQRLIELRKENWSVAFYPVEDHAFQRPESWADEYKRIFKLFEENLK